MRSSSRCMRVLTALMIIANLAGCTKRVQVPAGDYNEIVGSEDFVHITTTDGEVFQLQEAQVTDTSVSGLLRHNKGDVKPVGAGGKETQSAWIEIRLEDIQSLEVERINKKRVLFAFGAVAAGLAAAIIAVEGVVGSEDSGPGGDIPVKP